MGVLTFFAIGSSSWQFDGYLDIRGAEGTASSNMNFNPQLKLEIGQLFNTQMRLYTGIEYYRWNDKYGIEGINERALSLLFQVTFSKSNE